MEALVLDENFRSTHLIDEFESLLWVEAYNGAGNFELYTPVNTKMLEIMKQVTARRKRNVDTYLWLKDSNQTMIVDTMEIKTDSDTGSHLIVTGESLESILSRRIIWNQTILNGNLQNSVKRLLNENVISPSIADRKIANFSFEESKDPAITGLKISIQYTGDNLYDAIVEICNTNSIGFQVTLEDDSRFVFKLYAGQDRSYDQIKNPYVVFSPRFENIINSDYLDSITTLKNVALVAGEDQNRNRKTRVVGSFKGLARRELFVDARDIQSETTEGEAIPESEYNAQLDQRGTDKLAENKYTKAFEGEMETTKMYIYGRDFFQGDIVQVETEHGIEEKVRIVEIVRSQDTSGYKLYPTFSVLEE